MDIEDLKKKVLNDGYRVIVEYPKKPEGYKVENYVYDEEQSVRWNRERQQELTFEYQAKIKAYHDAVYDSETNFFSDIQNVLVNYYGFNRDQAEMLAQRAWEDGHSDGLETVVALLEDLADFMVDFIAKGKDLL